MSDPWYPPAVHEAAERMARQTLEHARRVADDLGEPLGHEEALAVIERVSKTIPDPEFAALVADKAKELL